jgi:signal transduction histidine kinase
MEAIGLVASVGQITAYAFRILETMQKIRAIARDGPDQLQEKVQQLDMLQRVVCQIQGNQDLRDEAIAHYLASIQKKIRRLLEAIRLNLSKLGARTLKGFFAAIHIISTEKLFDAAFVAINQDCSTLSLHIMSSPQKDVSTCLS